MRLAACTTMARCLEDLVSKEDGVLPSSAVDSTTALEESNASLQAAFRA